MLLHWTALIGLSKMAPVGAQVATTWGILLIYIPVVVIFVSVFVDWFTAKDGRRRYSKLIDTWLWGMWLISMLYMVGYSLAMGTL